MGPTIMEKFRRLERSILRSCTRLYRKAETDYRERISNTMLYQKANITKLDCFFLKLCRNYYASYQDINNPLMKKLKCNDEEKCKSKCQSGYITPEIFIFCEKVGVFQDAYNLPSIYHIKWHCKNKKINLYLKMTTSNTCSRQHCLGSTF